MAIHNLYYGGEHRDNPGYQLQEAYRVPDSRGGEDRIHHKFSQSQGLFPAGEVFPDIHYKMAAENGGVKNEPYHRTISPRTWFNKDEGGGDEPYDPGLSEYFRDNPPVAGDILRLAFVPREYTALWAAMRVKRAAPGLVADLRWVKSDGTTEVLSGAIDFNVRQKTGKLPIADGDVGEVSNNFLDLLIVTPATKWDEFTFTLDYQVEGYDDF